MGSHVCIHAFRRPLPGGLHQIITCRLEDFDEDWFAGRERLPPCSRERAALPTPTAAQVVDLCVRTEHESRGLSSCCG